MNKRYRIIGIGAVLLSLLLISSATALPVATEKQTQQKINLQTIKKQLTTLKTTDIVPLTEEQLQETTSIVCMVGDKKITKELSRETIQSLIDLGSSKKADFLTIYNKQATQEEVQQAFDNIQPFFNALITNGLTDKTVDELNDLYYNIREKIHEPRHQLIGKQQNRAQPMGIWNGVPTLVWANIACGIFDTGLCVGFAGGTHVAIPTIGADAFITYAFQGTSTSVGGAGLTVAIAAFQVIFGFVGILIATPLIMFGPYFMTGLCGALFGVGA